VWAGETALRRRLQPLPVLLGEVHRQPAGAEKLRHMLDRGVECVRERELRDRLADDRQERAGALELDRQRPPPLARTQCVGRAHGEDAQTPEQRVVRAYALGEQELQRALRRLSELQRHQRAVLERLQRERAGTATRAPDRIEPDRGLEVAAGERGQDGALRLVPPHQAGARAGGLGGERGDLVGGTRLVRAGGEGVAGQPEQVGRRDRGAVAVAEGAARQRDLVCGRRRQAPIALAEPPAPAQELERADDGVPFEDRQLQYAAGSHPLGDAP
jgi:hypothetical protein